MAIIRVSCSYCSVVSYAYAINYVPYHPWHAVVCFCVHCTQVLTSSPIHSPLWASPTFSLPQAFSLRLALQPHAPLHPTIYLCPSIARQWPWLCTVWDDLIFSSTSLSVSLALSGLYNRSRIRAIIAPWRLTAGVYCGFVWEGCTTALHHSWPHLHSDREHGQMHSLDWGPKITLTKWQFDKEKVMCVLSRTQGEIMIDRVSRWDASFY